MYLNKKFFFSEKSSIKINQSISDNAGSMRQKSRVFAASVGAKLRQLAAQRCRGGIWCRHATNEFNESFFYNDSNDKSIEKKENINESSIAKKVGA